MTLPLHQGKTIALASLLVLPLALLLFAQWPLRDWIQAHSRLANDMGQIVFAVYAAVAVTAASIAGCHLSAHLRTTGTLQKPPRWRAWTELLCVAPWALFLLWAAVPQALRSLDQAEKFAETLSPGYFILRWALVLLAALVLGHGIAGVLPARRPA
jgi:hypothetical protein